MLAYLLIAHTTCDKRMACFSNVINSGNVGPLVACAALRLHLLHCVETSIAMQLARHVLVVLIGFASVPNITKKLLYLIARHIYKTFTNHNDDLKTGSGRPSLDDRVIFYYQLKRSAASSAVSCLC